MTKQSRLRKDIEQAINKHSIENGSDTPDFILAEYLIDCLRAFDKATVRREEWYGRKESAEGSNAVVIDYDEDKNGAWVRYFEYKAEKSAMCEANSNAVLGDVVKLLTEYTQYLYKFGYLDDDWIMEASSPIQEFINKKFGNVV